MNNLNISYQAKAIVAGALLYFLTGNTATALPASAEGSVGKGAYALPQQSKITITGTVSDSYGVVIGASIMEKGTSNGTVTDVNGKFSLSVATQATLIVSYIGYETQEIATAGRTHLEITLNEDTKKLEEVVVVGYGTQKKVNLTGSVASVNFEEQSMSRPVTTVSAALAGLSAGVQVMQTSGQPGSDGASIRIRGVGTLNDSSPLVLIDGIEGPMDSVNPLDIESISVLKDAASASIYGSRAANGVILITTKSGEKGRVSVNYTGRMSISRPTHIISQVTNYADYMEWMNESYANIGSAQQFSQETIDLWREKSKSPNDLNENGVPNYVAYPNTDWQKAIFSNGMVHDHNVSVAGGSDKISFLLSSGYLDNQGLVPLTAVKKYSLRANIEAKPTSWLKVGTRTFGSFEDKDPGDFSNANNYLRQTTPGVYPRWNGQYGYPEAKGESSTANNLLLFLEGLDGQYWKTLFNTTLYSQVTFFKGFTWDVNLNFAREWREERYWTNAAVGEKVRLSDGTIITPKTDPSQLNTSFYNLSKSKYTLENILRYATTVNEDHDIGALAGYNEFHAYEYSVGGVKKGLIDQSVNVPGSATEMMSITGGAADRASRSFFGRINYAYKSRYLLEVNYRYDAHSRFHKDRRWGGFPGFSAGWRLTEEPFMERARKLFDNIKLRASWGKLGNAGGDNVGDYEYQSTYSITNYSIGKQQAQGLSASVLANSLLTWESTASTDIGLDIAMLNNRLTVEADYYDKNTNGILYRPTIYYTMGEKTPPRLNIAEMNNRGVELTVGWKDNVGAVSYYLSGNITFNRNIVKKYKGEYKAGWEVNDKGEKVWVSNIGQVSTGSIGRITEGKMKDEYYILDVYKGNASYFNADGTPNVNGGPKDGMIRTEKDMEWVKAMIDAGYKFMPNLTVDRKKIWYGDYIFADTNGDGIYGGSDDNRFTNYSMDPKYSFGWQLGASYKGFDFSMNWAGVAGRKIYWGSTTGYNSPSTRLGLGISTEIANNHYYYNPENPSDPRTNITAKYGRLVNGESGFQNSTSGTVLYLYSGDYIKLKNLTFGYTLPKQIAKRIFTENIRLYFSGENLLTFTDFVGQDPELKEAATYTSVKQLAFGANITF